MKTIEKKHSNKKAKEPKQNLGDSVSTMTGSLFENPSLKSSGSPKKQNKNGNWIKQKETKRRGSDADDEESEEDGEDPFDENSANFEDEDNVKLGGTKSSMTRLQKKSQKETEDINDAKGLMISPKKSKKETESLDEQKKRNDINSSVAKGPTNEAEKKEEVEKKKLEENEQKLKLKDNQIPPIPTAKTKESNSIPIWGWVCIALSIVLFLISTAGCCGYFDDCCCCGVQELNFDDDHIHVKEQYKVYKDVSHQSLPRDLNIDVDHEEFGTLSSLFNDNDLQKAQDDICGIRNMQNELRSFDVEDSAQNDAEESCSIVHAQEPKPTSQLDYFLAQKMGKEKNEKSSLEIQENINNIEQLA